MLFQHGFFLFKTLPLQKPSSNLAEHHRFFPPRWLSGSSALPLQRNVLLPSPSAVPQNATRPLRSRAYPAPHTSQGELATRPHSRRQRQSAFWSAGRLSGWHVQPGHPSPARSPSPRGGDPAPLAPTRRGLQGRPEPQRTGPIPPATAPAAPASPCRSAAGPGGHSGAGSPAATEEEDGREGGREPPLTCAARRPGPMTVARRGAMRPKLRRASRVRSRVARLRSPLTIPRPGPQPPALSSRRLAARRQAAISCRREASEPDRHRPGGRPSTHAPPAPRPPLGGRRGGAGRCPAAGRWKASHVTAAAQWAASLRRAAGRSCAWSASRAALSNSLVTWRRRVLPGAGGRSWALTLLRWGEVRRFVVCRARAAGRVLRSRPPPALPGWAQLRWVTGCCAQVRLGAAAVACLALCLADLSLPRLWYDSMPPWYGSNRD